VQQGKTDSHCRSDAGSTIADSDGQLSGSPVQLAYSSGNAGVSSAHIVETRLVTEWAGLARQ